MVLTTHRILWGKPGDIPKGLTCLSLHLYYVFCIEEESGGVFGLGGLKRIILHLGPALPGKFRYQKSNYFLFNWCVNLIKKKMPYFYLLCYKF